MQIIINLLFLSSIQLYQDIQYCNFNNCYFKISYLKYQLQNMM
ncbi:hypothetical protein pb186bvf_000684 [Paramecium bursaria]